MSDAYTVRFDSERFDYASELPESFNAGNRFYGRDVAEFLCGELVSRGFEASFLDEDWGWLVCGRGPQALVFETAVYNLADHGEGGRPGVGSWGLRSRAWRRTKVLGFLPRNAPVPVPNELAAAIRAAVQAAGAEPVPWADGPDA